MLLIKCESCGALVCKYQKDGPGPLLRMYVDRIFDSESAISNGSLNCKKCKMLLGTKITYKKENRPAYRLYAGAIIKEIIPTN